jgi:hypothetical protein
MMMMMMMMMMTTTAMDLWQIICQPIQICHI